MVSVSQRQRIAHLYAEKLPIKDFHFTPNVRVFASNLQPGNKSQSISSLLESKVNELLCDTVHSLMTRYLYCRQWILWPVHKNIVNWWFIGISIFLILHTNSICKNCSSRKIYLKIPTITRKQAQFNWVLIK